MYRPSLVAFWREESDQDLDEYSLLVAFMAVAAIAILNSISGDILPFLVGMSSALAAASKTGSVGP